MPFLAAERGTRWDRPKATPRRLHTWGAARVAEDFCLVWGRLADGRNALPFLLTSVGAAWDEHPAPEDLHRADRAASFRFKAVLSALYGRVVIGLDLKVAMSLSGSSRDTSAQRVAQSSAIRSLAQGLKLRKAISHRRGARALWASATAPRINSEDAVRFSARLGTENLVRRGLFNEALVVCPLQEASRVVVVRLEGVGRGARLLVHFGA